MLKIPIIAIALLALAGCAGNPSSQAAGQQAASAASSPKSKRCVNRCTDDYSVCVAQGRASGGGVADCEPTFRSCVDGC